LFIDALENKYRAVSGLPQKKLFKNAILFSLRHNLSFMRDYFLKVRR
jgi:hypothetical protein